jgi:myo-inositol-1(or 4)-monophosphatase
VGGRAAAGGLSGDGEQELLAVAREAAETVGALLRERFEAGHAGAVRTKTSPTDLVSEADTEAEREIRRLLAARRPDDAVVGEEGDDRDGTSGLRWFVDPIDGTINFVHGLPAWTVTLACADGAGTVAGVVHDPLRGETFAATRSGEATVNGAPVRPPVVTRLSQALVATGFGYEVGRRTKQGEIAGRVIGAAADLRRIGSAAMDLAWTACGRMDAFYERGLNPWDAAAGALICVRAGLDVCELPPADGLPAGLLAAPAAIADELQALVE